MRHKIIVAIKKSLQAIFYKRFFFNTSKNKKMILSFDDAIGDDREKILAILGRHNINATFFLTGKYIKENNEIVRKAHFAGHIIANHTYFHEDITKTPLRSLVKSLTKTEEEIQKITGQTRRLFRPPCGKISPLRLMLCLLLGYKIAMWSLGGGDFDDNNWQETTNRILSNKSKELNNIILLHLELDRSIITLENIIEPLIKEGVSFISFDEIL